MSLQNKVIDLLRLINSSDIKLVYVPNCFVIDPKIRNGLWGQLNINIYKGKTHIIYWWTLPDGLLGRNEFSFRNDILVKYTNPFNYDKDTQIFSIMNNIGIKIQ